MRLLCRHGTLGERERLSLRPLRQGLSRALAELRGCSKPDADAELAALGADRPTWRVYQCASAAQAMRVICRVAKRLDPRHRVGACRSVMRRLLQGLAAPRTLVDKTPHNLSHAAFVARGAAMFASARFVHLLRHPVVQMRSWMALVNDSGSKVISNNNNNNKPYSVTIRLLGCLGF